MSTKQHQMPLQLVMNNKHILQFIKMGKSDYKNEFVPLETQF